MSEKEETAEPEVPEEETPEEAAMSKSSEESDISGDEGNSWKLHDIYDEDICWSRILTRSQVAHIRLKKTSSDLELFANKDLHNPPGKPHLMVTLKGEYGALPRTIVTRRYAKNIGVSEELSSAVTQYKKRSGLIYLGF